MAQEDISEELLPLLRYQAAKRGLTVRPDALFRLSEIERVMQRSFEHEEIECMVNECTNRHRNVPRFETATDKYGEVWIRAKYKVQLRGVERKLLEIPANVCLAKNPPPLPPVIEAEAEGGPAVNGWAPTRPEEAGRAEDKKKTEAGRAEEKKKTEAGRGEDKKKNESTPAEKPRGEDAKATRSSRAKWEPRNPPSEVAERASASGLYRPPHRRNNGGQQPHSEEAKPPVEDAKGPQPLMGPWAEWRAPRPQTPPEEEEVIQGPPYVGSSSAGGANAAEGEEAAASSSWATASDPVVERVHQRSLALQRQYELNEERIDEQAVQIDEQRLELNELRELVASLREQQEELRRWRSKDSEPPAAGNKTKAALADGGKEGAAPVGGWTRRQELRKLRSKEKRSAQKGSTPQSADDSGCASSSAAEAGQ